LACWLALLTVGDAQQPPSPQVPTFRTAVDIVQMDVTVLDKDRRPVRGLTAADFTVLENGAERPIVSFMPVELTRSVDVVPPSGIGRLTPDVATNALPNGRIVVFLMDFQGGPGASRVTAQRVGERLIESLGPGDLVAVGHTMFGRPQNLTTDPTRIREAIETSVMGTVTVDGDDSQRGACLCGRCRLDAITDIANGLREDPHRRKSIIFVGSRSSLYDAKSAMCNAILKEATERMLHATHAANVAVHAVDPGGLEVSSVGASVNIRPETGSKTAAVLEQNNRVRIVADQESLRELAAQTGGRVILNTNAPENSLRAVLDESSSYYFLAFQAAVSSPDGRFHPVSVKVKRPGLTVRTRSGYYAQPGAAASPSTEETAETLARHLLPRTGLPLVLTAAPFRGAAGDAAVVLSVGVEATRSDAKGHDTPDNAGADPKFEEIEILSSASSIDGPTTPWHRQKLQLVIPDPEAGALLYEAASKIDLKPGRYEVRVAVRQGRPAVTGTVHTYVDVPDFDKLPLSLSGVVLHDSDGRTITPPEAIGGALAGPPTARRHFATTDQVVALAKVYQAGVPPSGVTVSFRVLDRDEREVRRERVLLETSEFPTGAADLQFDLPLSDLPPGAYALVVEAAKGAATARRDVRFTVQ
jgi:VWFA-related protein